MVDLPDQVNLTAGVDDAFRITEELLKQKRTFSALMAYDDMTAFGALRALAKAGIKVPQDCSLIGFDDINPSQLFVPSLTTVRQPMEAMGASAVSILIEGSARPPRIAAARPSIANSPQSW